MGGEHWCCISTKCIYHDKQKYDDEIYEIFTHTNHTILRHKHLNIWPKLRGEIIRFIKLCYCHSQSIRDEYKEINNLIKIFNKQNPFDIDFGWDYHDDFTDLGMMYHDIVTLITLAYPNLFCIQQDRCLYNINPYHCNFVQSNILNFNIYKIKNLHLNCKSIEQNKQTHMNLVNFTTIPFLIKLISPTYLFDIYDNKKIPYKLQILMLYLPKEIVNIIGQYVYFVYHNNDCVCNKCYKIIYI